MLVVVSCFNFVCFSKLVGGVEIKALLLEINIQRFVSSVLPPTKVNQASGRRNSNPRVSHVLFVCQACSRCSERIVAT